VEAAVSTLTGLSARMRVDQRPYHAASPRRRISPTPLASRSSRSRTIFSCPTSNIFSPSLPSNCRAVRSRRRKARRLSLRSW
jgi:hypothetical protein